MKPKHLVIDGYNVLGAMGWPPDKVLQSEGKIVEEFLAQLSAYAQRVHTSMTVIFDAWRQPGKTRQVQHRAGITVMYSSEGERADHILQQILRKSGKDAGIVSSDHEILTEAEEVTVTRGACSKAALPRPGIRGGEGSPWVTLSTGWPGNRACDVRRNLAEAYGSIPTAEMTPPGVSATKTRQSSA